MTTQKQGAEHIRGNHSKGSTESKDSSGTDQTPGAHHRGEDTKYAAACKIWDQMHDEHGEQIPRHEALERAINEAGMTANSASTMYQNWRTEHGLVGGGSVNSTGNDDSSSSGPSSRKK